MPLHPYIIVMRTLLFYISTCFISYSVAAQAIGNIYSFGTKPEASSVRLSYDNDFFTATDKYYTQGIQLTITNNGLKYSPLNYLLIKGNGASVYGVSIEHNAYTPTHIAVNTILYGDRPYTAALMLNSFSVYTDSAKKQKWISSVSLGVMGRHASGEWMQRSIHRWLDNIQPEGWQYQLKNNPVINYSISHERNLLSLSNHLSVAAIASVHTGTLIDKAEAGLYIMAGSFNPPYTSANRKNFRTHIYAYPAASFIGYDATLEGGIFTKNNIYAIPAKDIQRILFNGRAGIVFSYAGISLEHFYGFSTKTFRTQQNVAWGGVSMIVGF